MVLGYCYARVHLPSGSLARRPGEPPPRQHVEVEVKDGLPGACALVGDDPVAFAVPKTRPQFGSDCEELHRDLRLALGDEIAQMGRVARRNHQEMGRRLRIEVVERDDVLIAELLGCGNLPAHDLAENAIVVHDLGLISSKLRIESGLGMTLSIEAFM